MLLLPVEQHKVGTKAAVEEGEGRGRREEEKRYLRVITSRQPFSLHTLHEAVAKQKGRHTPHTQSGNKGVHGANSN